MLFGSLLLFSSFFFFPMRGMRLQLSSQFVAYFLLGEVRGVKSSFHFVFSLSFSVQADGVYVSVIYVKNISIYKAQKLYGRRNYFYCGQGGTGKALRQMIFKQHFQ